MPLGGPMGLRNVGNVGRFQSRWGGGGGERPVYLVVGIWNVSPSSWRGIVGDSLFSGEASITGLVMDVGTRGFLFWWWMVLVPFWWEPPSVLAGSRGWRSLAIKL